jgi:hypothetical protein
MSSVILLLHPHSPPPSKVPPSIFWKKIKAIGQTNYTVDHEFHNDLQVALYGLYDAHANYMGEPSVCLFLSIHKSVFSRVTKQRMCLTNSLQGLEKEPTSKDQKATSLWTLGCHKLLATPVL